MSETKGVTKESNTEEVYSWCVANPQPGGKYYRVFKWVWYEFESKPSDEVRAQLKASGFHWNQSRGVWQHACGEYRRHSKVDPRLTYGVEDASA